MCLSTGGFLLLFFGGSCNNFVVFVFLYEIVLLCLFSIRFVMVLQVLTLVCSRFCFCQLRFFARVMFKDLFNMF